MCRESGSLYSNRRTASQMLHHQSMLINRLTYNIKLSADDVNAFENVVSQLVVKFFAAVVTDAVVPCGVSGCLVRSQALGWRFLNSSIKNRLLDALAI